MLNHYIWSLYLKSGGAETVDMFRRNLREKLTAEYAQKIADLQKTYCVMDTIVDTTKTQLKDLYEFHSSPDYVPENESVDPDDQMKGMYEDFLEDTGSPANAFASFAYGLSFIGPNRRPVGDSLPRLSTTLKTASCQGSLFCLPFFLFRQ